MITIKEIAKRANVSIGTVDRVLHKRGRVSKETKDKINKIIKQTDYKTNIFARHLKLSKTFHLGVLMPKLSQESHFWEITKRGIDRALKELSIYHIKNEYFFFDRFDEKSFNNASSELLKKKLDGIIIAPVLYKLSKVFIKKISEHIPYVFFNTDIPGSNAISFIGQDSFQSGVVSAKLLKSIITVKGEIAAIRGSSDDEEHHHTERVKGFMFFFENNKDYEIKYYSIKGKAEKKSFYELMDIIIKENKELKGIFVTSASCHYIAEYIKEKNIKKKIYLIGYDLVDKNVHYLNEGFIDFLISQRTEEQGYQAVYELYKKLLLREVNEKKIMMPIDVIIKENLMYYHYSREL